jgi:hypothetical protein
MLLSRTDIEKFQEIYSRVFGITLGEEDARSKGSNLINLMQTICKPMKEETLKRLKKNYYEQYKN